MPSRLVGGVSAAFRGLSVAMASPEIRRTYLQLVLAIFALTLLLDAAGIWAIVALVPEGAGVAETIALMLLKIAAGAILLLAAPLLAVLVANIVFPMLNERVFLAGLRVVDAERAESLAQSDGLPVTRAIGYSLIRLAQFVGLSAVAFLLSLIPVAGPILGPVLQVLVTSRMLGWELLDPYFDKRRMTLSEQRAYIRANAAPVVGFALPYGFIMAVPIVGPLLFGVAQAGTAVLLVDVLEPRQSS
jgi:uncharacterized protein involved in cysteine biosynthesis